MKKSIPWAAALVAAGLAVPAAAEAATTCTYDAASKRVDVAIGSSVTGVQIDGSGKIRAGGDICGLATATNTDLIKAVDQTGSGVELVLQLGSSGFAPGAAFEPGAREIEIMADLGSGSDMLRVDGGIAGSYVVAGSAGVNLNPGAEPEGVAGTDADVTLVGVEKLRYLSKEDSTAGNVFTAQGGRGTGGPFAGETLLEGGDGNDALWGGSGIDEIYGYGGNDTVRGYVGDDELIGGPGDDAVAGGAGRDYAPYLDAPSSVDVDLAIPGPQNTGGAGVDELSEIERVDGSQFDDELRGTGGTEHLRGAGGNDLLAGRGGDDMLEGGTGDDRLRPGLGDDWAYGWLGRDVVDYSDAPGGVTVDLSLDGTDQPTGSAGTDKIQDVADVDGSPFADVLAGDAGANALRGGAGADTLTGAAGSDLLDGGSAADQVNGTDGEADQIACDSLDTRLVDPIDTLIDCPAPPVDAGGGTTGGSTGGTTTGTAGSTAGTPAAKPELAVTVLRPTARSKRRGVRLRLVASADVSAKVRVQVSRRTARKLGLRRVLVGQANLALEAGKRRVLVVAVPRKALRAPLTVRAGASDAAGQVATPITRRIG